MNSLEIDFGSRLTELSASIFDVTGSCLSILPRSGSESQGSENLKGYQCGSPSSPYMTLLVLNYLVSVSINFLSGSTSSS